jgi:hypothetical protein
MIGQVSMTLSPAVVVLLVIALITVLAVSLKRCNQRVGNPTPCYALPAL